MAATVLFYLAAALALVSAFAVILARSPLRGALALITSLSALALLYILLDASFVASMQVLVYAGAIMVLFIFVIMLLNLQPGAGRPLYLSISKILGSVAGLYLFVSLFRGAKVALVPGGPLSAVDGTVKNIGRLLLTDYLFAFEAISVLLLVAVVGAVVLGLKRTA